MRKLPQIVPGDPSKMAQAINRNAFIHEAESCLIEFSNVPSGGLVTGELEVGKSILLIRCRYYQDMRVRFYSHAGGPGGDAGRAFGDPWPPVEGIAIDAQLVYGTLLSTVWNPQQMIGNTDNPRTANLYYSLTNLEPVTGDLQLEILYSVLEH